MKKFSKINKTEIKNVETNNDIIVMFVHLLDFNEILLKKEVVDAYQERENQQEFFLTSIEGNILNETPIVSLKRNLSENVGILLNTNYSNYEEIGQYFISKNTSSKYHIYYIPLRMNDYRQVTSSNKNENSKTVRVDVKFLDSLKVSDLITAFNIEKLKQKLK